MISILIIGNEILSANVEDINLKYMLEKLSRAGHPVDEVRIVRDDIPVIAEAIRQLSARSQYVISSGGVGPTHDDVTYKAYALAYETDLFMNPELEQLIRGYFDGKVKESSLRMALVPRNAELVQTGASWPTVKVGNCFVLPGLPEVFIKKFDHLLDWLPKAPDRYYAELYTSLNEVDFANELTTLQEQRPGVEMGSYPTYDRTEFAARLTFKGNDVEALNAAWLHMRAHFKQQDVLVRALDPHKTN